MDIKYVVDKIIYQVTKKFQISMSPTTVHRYPCHAVLTKTEKNEGKGDTVSHRATRPNGG